MKLPFELCSITISAGTLRMQQIEMSLTYDGLIEGGPGERVNDMLVDFLTRPQPGRGGNVYEVPPARTVEGETELLPPVRCIGFFRGPCTTAHNPDWLYTHLTIGWFQQPYSTGLIHPDAVEQMRDLPWRDVATDVTWQEL
ncbi:hypothetical protein [Nocardia sp. XZ_19_385]|uniref:hypothetical protein n=1 Tax=Nocardia sp. XZ_19_385 TaxID=2769488 RepID=UPI00188F071D|nr:hypothetical protein [Nocardia sp. XZ_19_385]